MATKTPPAPPDSAAAARLRRRALQYLVHCFLYYRLNESVIPDEQFDGIAADLRRLREQYPQADMPYAAILDPVLGPEVSGFQIREYPEPIISTAFKLLYGAGNPAMDFEEFVERRGYRAQWAESEDR
jgi:hypothetical protein